jgi:DNA-binding CsgD family transcriptional regulator/tetratricopeptide (TPR) repeat protein
MELLERQQYLSELDSAFAQACNGSGQIVSISGEAGIGKTSLIEVFIHSHIPSVPVYWGLCDSLFVPRPLGPVYDMAGQLHEDLPRLLASDAQRTVVFPTVLKALQGQVSIIVFEDVHWADEVTLDLLRFLGRRISRTSALLVLTHRDDELSLQHPLRHVLGDLAVSRSAHHIRLNPLSEDSIRALVGGRSIDVASLHRKTGGNPFYITEILSRPAGEIPLTIRDAVLARAARLSPSAEAVLQSAAVIGARVEPWLLVKVTGAEASFVEECIDVGILYSLGDIIAFRHELTRQTILGTLSPQRSQVLHQLTLEALKSSPAARHDLVRLAHHAESAGDREAVLEFAPAAAKKSSAAGAHREAATLYSLALRFAADLPPNDRASFLVAYADECNLIDQREEGLKARQEALVLWHELGEPLKQGETLASMAFLLNGLGRASEAEQASRQAIELLESHPPSRELAFAFRVQSGLRMLSHDYRAAIAWGEKSIALAERFQDMQLVLATSIPIGSAWLFLDYEYGRQYLECILAAAIKAGLETVAAHAYANLSSTSSILYRFEMATSYTTKGTDYAVEHGQDRYKLYMLAWQAQTHMRQGAWSESINLAESVLQHPGLSATTRITALVALGYVYARQGDPAATGVLDEALELSRYMDSLHRIGLVHAARAESAWLAGDRRRTLEEARAVYHQTLSKQQSWYAGELAFWCWRAEDKVTLFAWMAKPYTLHIAGDWRAAALAWEELGCPYERACALADGDSKAQVTALKIFDRLGARPAADRLRLRLQQAGVIKIAHASTRENPFGLTRRQVEILGLLIEGLSNTEISARLHISPKTADHHVSAILEKMDIHSREEAALLARAHPHFSEK